MRVDNARDVRAENAPAPAAAPDGSPLRAVAAILGATAVMLGSLNVLLAWYGGYDATPLPGFLILVGIVSWATSRAGRPVL